MTHERVRNLDMRVGSGLETIFKDMTHVGLIGNRMILKLPRATFDARAAGSERGSLLRVLRIQEVQFPSSTSLL